jgi:hypothetical protein
VRWRKRGRLLLKALVCVEETRAETEGRIKVDVKIVTLIRELMTRIDNEEGRKDLEGYKRSFYEQHEKGKGRWGTMRALTGVDR